MKSVKTLLLFLYLSCVCQSVCSRKSALIIIDVQTCFVTGGSLAVTDGDDVIPVINKIRGQFQDRFSAVVVSQDWHCPHHVSFAASFPNKNDFDTIDLKYRSDGSLCDSPAINTATFPEVVTCDPTTSHVDLQQVLWPVHCVANVTSGPTSSNLVDSLHTETSDVIIQKGSDCYIDSYSVFFDNGGLKSTGLEQVLRMRGVDTVFVVGLALDYCVYYTALDARRLGFETYTVLDAARGVAPDTVESAKRHMVETGVNLIYSREIADVLDVKNTSVAASTAGGQIVVVLCLQLVTLAKYW